MPVRAATLQSNVAQSRFLLNLQQNTFRFLVVDNEVSIASTAAFSTFNSKVLLDGPNAVQGSSMSESVNREIFVVDNKTGAPVQFVDEDVSRKQSRKTFITNSRQALWETRQLLHSLRGRQISFYLPTFQEEFDPLTDVVSVNDTIDVTNVGYTLSGQNRAPKNVIRFTFADGTSLVRTIIGSSEVSSTIERLQVDSTFGVNQVVADIVQIDFVEKVRLDTDRVVIEHRDGLGQAVIAAPVRTVVE